MTESDLRAEIQTKESEHRKWESSDFVRAQLTLWIGILTSIAASLNATGVIPRPGCVSEKAAALIAAVIAAIPAGVIVVDKTFKWSARSSWHRLYGIRLRMLLRSMDFGGVDAAMTSEKLGKVELEMHNTFPALDAGALVPTKGNS